MSFDDAAAVARVRDGDDDAFRGLVERHSRGVYRVAYRMTGTAEDAEDVVQETFVRAYRQLGQFEARANFATWIYRIAFNCAIDLIRARAGRARRERREPPEMLETLAGQDLQPPADLMAYGAEIGTRVRVALNALSPQERAAFLLRHDQGCSIDEICGALNVTASAARHAVFRGVRKMREALRPLIETMPQRER
jgi:RNA polymerase sigma-70 factor (ECF subfamily)